MVRLDVALPSLQNQEFNSTSLAAPDGDVADIMAATTIGQTNKITIKEMILGSIRFQLCMFLYQGDVCCIFTMET
jgi:hypothetical protein